MAESAGGPGADWSARVRLALTVVLAVVFVLSLGATAYVAVNPPSTGTPYTEFYLLNQTGVAADYPTNLTVGESGEVLVGVGNHEQEPVSYSLVVRAGDRTIHTRTFSLEHDDSRELPVTYAFQEPGDVRLQFLLYRGDATSESEPYREARLLVRVDDGA